jgi:hypothetical protein
MRGLAKIGLRLMLIYTFISIFSSGVILVTNTMNADRFNQLSTAGILTEVIAYIIALAIIVLLFARAETIVRWLTGNMEDTQITVSTCNADLYNLLLRFLGIIFAIQSIAALLGLSGSYFTYSGSELHVTETASFVNSLIKNGVMLVAGIILIVGAKRISAWSRDLWERGGAGEPTDKEDQV